MNLLPGFGVSGYRSFGAECPQTLYPLAKVNLIAGQNNAGKSNILRFIEIASRLAREDAPVLGSLDIPRVGGSGSPLLHLPALSPDQDWRGRAANRRHQNTIDAVVSLLEDHSPADGIWIPTEVKRRSGRKHAVAEGWSEDAASRLSVGPQEIEPLVQSIASSWMVAAPSMLRQLVDSLALPLIPPVVTIPAFRRLVEKVDGDASVWHGGEGLISELRNLESPTAERQDDLNKWEKIQQFVRVILGDSDVTLAIPAQQHTINIRRGGELMPLENQGTGIHEVVILAAAATLLEDTLVCIEEPEVHLHPLLQRQLVRYLDEATSNQYLIATHSAHLIDTDIASVFHVTLTDNGSTIAPVQDAGSRSRLVADLGYRASDLVQANAIIWVEGPSDRIYIRHWLQLADASLIEGLHYSIMFYGGRLLNHLSPNDTDVEDFISLRRMNRHVAVIIDSDKASAHKRINRTKARVKMALNSGGGMVWVTAGYTIENYVPPSLLIHSIEKSHPNVKAESAGKWTNPLGASCVTPVTSRSGRPVVDKVQVARVAVGAWTDSTERPYDLDQRIRELLSFVHGANGISAAPEGQWVTQAK